jgi:hypothetical protein
VRVSRRSVGVARLASLCSTPACAPAPPSHATVTFRVPPSRCRLGSHLSERSSKFISGSLKIETPHPHVPHADSRDFSCSDGSGNPKDRLGFGCVGSCRVRRCARPSRTFLPASGCQQHQPIRHAPLLGVRRYSRLILHHLYAVRIPAHLTVASTRTRRRCSKLSAQK